jgi:aminomethyltransferase
MFDVSHMRVVDLEGAGARDFLRYALANNVDKLTVPGKALYSCLLTPAGTVIDDLIVYFLREDFFRLVVNAGTADKDIAWFRKLLAERAPALKLSPREDLAMIAVQGPNARAKVWKALPGSEAASAALSPFNAARHGDAFIARTGYTGEDGFEIVYPAAKVDALWTRLAAEGVRPCGLGARDTLRLEAGMRLHGNDIDESTTAVEADLNWIVGWKKDDFIGAGVLRDQKASGPARKIVGFEMLERGIGRHGYDAYIGDAKVGVVTSGTQTPHMKKAIGMAYLPIEHNAPGTEFDVDIRGRRTRARVVPMPFYKRPK